MSEKTYTETEVQALVAAALQRAKTIADGYHQRALEWAKNVRGLEKYIDETDSSRIAADILALMDTDHAALEAVKAQARENREQGIEKHLAAIMSQLEANEGYFSGNDLVTLQILQSHIKDSVAAIRAGKVQP